MAIAADCLLDCKHYQGDAVFYLMSATAEDQETQRRGIVTMCIIASSQLPKMECMDAVLSASLEDFGANFYSWCPLKCNAHHHWIHDGNFIQTQKEKKEIGDFTPFASKSIKQSHRDICASHVSTSISLMAGGAIFNTIMNCMGKEYRIRSRLHEGSI